MEPVLSRLRRFLLPLSCLKSKFRGPLAAGNKFLVLEEDYLDKFDEIVVIGDIHGCAEEFAELLDKVHSETPSKNPDKCLKILAGDLVNKGPNSQKVLKICVDKYPSSIIAVRGNHDEIVLDEYKSYKEGKKELGPNRKWIEDLPDRYLQYLSLLPYSIRIPSLKAIIVHGGLKPGLNEAAVETPTHLMTTMRNITVMKDEKTNEPYYECVKSDKVGVAWATFWPGPEHVYFGHDAKRRLQNEHEFATGLDTGCVYGDSLSYVYIKGPRKGELNCIKAKKVYQEVKKSEQALQ